MAPNDNPPYAGRTFGGYTARDPLGQGASAEVFRATPTDDDHAPSVVLKLVTPDPHDPSALLRLRQEAQVMTQLDDPNIVRAFSSGDKDGVHYLVLEHIEGPTLGELLERRGAFSWQSATRALKQLVSALAAIHARGIVHRDVKPQNILVAAGGLLKLFDFGLAKTGRTDPTQAGDILGSPAYMAPEQWGDHEVDHRCDLFAAGVVYYQLLTGSLPFQGRTPADFSWKIQSGTYPPLTDAAPDTPPHVQHVVAQLLERDRNFRPRDARSLLMDLEKLLQNRPPDVPRLERLDDREHRLPLIGHPLFTLGNAPDAQLLLDHPSLDPHHATLERTAGGLLLRALGDPLRTRVNDDPTSEILLRDRDHLQFADAPPLRYREGNLKRGSSGRLAPPSSDHYRIVTRDEPHDPPTSLRVGGLLAHALSTTAHPQALLMCFEALDPAAVEAAVEASRQRLAGQRLLPLPEADAVKERARSLASEGTWRLVDRMFRTTRENLGRSVESWISWWFEMRNHYPVQLRPPTPPPTAQLLPTGDLDLPPLPLADADAWVLGRNTPSDLIVPHRSVSRRHLTVLRLITRFAVVDHGSRFGTSIGGQRCDVGLLHHGDTLGLGNVRLRFEDLLPDQEETTAPTGALPVDPHTFRALVERRSPTTAHALVTLLDHTLLTQTAVRSGADHADPAELTHAVTTTLNELRGLALEALPDLAGQHLGPDPEPWTNWIFDTLPTLPRQVEPLHWDLL